MSIQKFSPVLRDALAPCARDPRLEMDRDGDLAIYYAPFESVNRQAKLVLVGITPGPTQMVNACMAARSVLQNGGSHEEAIGAGKMTGAFSGEPLRSNLLRQLRHWGVHEWLQIDDVEDLFGRSRHLLQTTSLIRYPAFVGETPYDGTPNMLGHPLLRRYLDEFFVREVQELADAVFVSLGATVQRVLEALVAEGVLPRERVITGMQHPSGQSTYRINYLVGPRSEAPPHATNVSSYDAGRDRFRKTYLSTSRSAVESIAPSKRIHANQGEVNTMGTLTDIAIEHTYTGKKTSAPVTFTMHPYQNAQGEHEGLFEVLRDIKEDGAKRKRSAHLTASELAEAYARGIIEQFEIRLRLRPATGAYPDSPPGKKVPLRCVVQGSDFDRMVRAVDVARPISQGLKRQLNRLGL